MATREYNILALVETPTLPAPSAPVSSTDMLTKGYGDQNYAKGIDTVANLKLLGTSARSANLPIFCVELQAWFYYVSASTATGNDLTVLTPSDTTGRWLRIQSLTSFTLVNNQASAANVTGLSFDKTKIRSFVVEYTLYRSASGGLTRAQRGTLVGVTDGTNWEMIERPYAGEAGVTFSITSAGQVQYVSDDNTGSYSAPNSVMKFKIADLMEI